MTCSSGRRADRWIGIVAAMVVGSLARPLRAEEARRPVAAKPVVASYAASVPPVMLTARETKLCEVSVGDTFPEIELPQLAGSGGKSIQALAGKQATVVLFWTPDRWMSREALTDLANDVVKTRGAGGVAVVGVATGQPADKIQQTLAKTGASFPQLLDADGAALAKVGVGSLPRVYVLDSKGRVAWFDIEYSSATRRELRQTLDALTAVKK